MSAIQKKVCLVGSFAVGKTSLVRRFVSGYFTEEYLTTVGVKIDRAKVETSGGTVHLLIWDLSGRDDFARVRQSHLAGASGFLFVADGTRKETLAALIEEMEAIEPLFPGAASAVLINKGDLEAEWEIDDAELEMLRRRHPVWKTSAKTGDQVFEAFRELAERMISQPG